MLHVFLLLAIAALVATAARVGRGFVAQALDDQRPAPVTGTRLMVLSREVVLRVGVQLFAPLGWSSDRPPPAPTSRSVLLVQDPAWPRLSMRYLEIFLTSRGFTVWLPPRPDRGRPLAEHAETVAAALTAWLDGSDIEQVDVVAFGAGGLAAAWLAAHRAHTPIRRLVALGSPWRGTRMAVFSSGALASELSPGSPSLDGLLPPSVPTVSVWCPQDPELVPPTTAVADPEHSVAVEGVGHLGLLTSSRTLRAVAEALTREPAS